MKPAWMEVALAELGVHELAGPLQNNPRIIEYGTAVTLKPKTDEIPWCSDFVNWCLMKCGLKRTASAAADSWDTYGTKLEVPVYGCITRIRQKHKSTDSSTGSFSGNHVALFDRIENGYLYLLGGNQSDSVKISGFNLQSYEVVRYCWPEGD